jgi:lysozyme family protein
MHFDTAVNHGVGTAIRMLQTLLSVDVDGEIGPETLNAARRRPLAALLAACADARRQRYRSLPHFWRFGRGWLARVDKTLAAAAALMPLSQGSSMPNDNASTTDTVPTTTTPSDPAPKWWGHSMTLWGTFITAVSTVLPVIGPLFGIDISAAMIRDLGASVTVFLQAAGGLIGTALAIYGRLRAASPLVRTTVAVTL